MGTIRGRAVGSALLAAAVGLVAAVPVAAEDDWPEPEPAVEVSDTEPAALDWSRSRPEDELVNELASEAERVGSVQVIAGLPIEWAPEGHLSAAATKRQRHAIQEAQDGVVELAGPEAVLRRFDTVPFVALRLDVGLLFLLAGSGLIATLARDEVHVPLVADGTRLVGAQAANTRGYTGAGRTVAILDTGVDPAHPFLIGRVVHEACFGTCPNGTATMTGVGAAAPCKVAQCEHGTHVAGIAAGARQHVFPNFDGVAPRASIAAVQIYRTVSNSAADPPGRPMCDTRPSPCVNSFSSDIIAGLEHVLSLHRQGHNVDAANISAGSVDTFAMACDISAIKPAIDNLRSFGVATVIASGNSSSTTGISHPACISTAIAVGASTKADGVAALSNSSPLVDLLAPGENITSSVPGGGFVAGSGTSLAAPYVAGAWALLRQRRPNMPVAVGLRVLSHGPRLTGPGSFSAPRISVDDALRRLRDRHDINADGVTDLAVFRPSPGTWLVNGGGSGMSFGQAGDIPVPADYDGNGSTDVAVYRPSTSTYLVRGSIPQWAPHGSVPVPGDYSGDGIAERAVWSPQTGEWRYARPSPVQWGQPGDVPVPGDYDGNGTTDFAVWRPSTGQWLVKDQPRTVHVGQPGDVPVPDDYNHDGRTDFAVWRPATGEWRRVDSALSTLVVDHWGQPGDIPAPRDLDGDGRLEHVVFRPSRCQWWFRYPGIVPPPTFVATFGAPGDIPV